VSFRIISPTETDSIALSDPIGKSNNLELAILSFQVMPSHSKNVAYFCSKLIAMINITENSFLKDPTKAIERLKKEHQILKVVSDDKSFVVIDEEEWNNIYETLYLNSIKGHAESIIRASQEDIENATVLKDLEW
jgi:PHD/YefM family antitoxin component YafN of YafNO toxin-antitoxin module